MERGNQQLMSPPPTWYLVPVVCTWPARLQLVSTRPCEGRHCHLHFTEQSVGNSGRLSNLLVITEFLRNGEKTSLHQGKTGTLKERQKGLLLGLCCSGEGPMCQRCWTTMAGPWFSSRMGRSISTNFFNWK